MSAECTVCQGTGFELHTRADGVTTAVRCNCVRADHGDRRLRGARIPRRYDHCTLDSFEPHHPSHNSAKSLAEDWVSRWPVVEHGILFLGRPGTGKTHLAVGIARDLALKKGARVLFFEQRQLLKELQSTFDSGASRNEADVLGPVLDTEILVLDDLGAGRTTLWARDVLHDIIAHRYNEQLPLIMTSNLPTDDDKSETTDVVPEGMTLRDRLGDSLMSRMYEMCLVVVVEGQDYRRGVLHARHRF